MTSVNSPASLLARNHFYRSLPSSPEAMSPTLSCQNDSNIHKQNRVTLCHPPGLPLAMGTKGLSVEIVLGPSPSPSNKRHNPRDQHVK